MEKQPESVIEAVELRLIATDTSMQSRVKMDDATVAEYAAAMVDGDSFPPIALFFDGAVYWVADGFHRVAAARAAKRDRIRAEIRHGDRRSAILASVGANASHGLRRTNADKRKAVSTLLEDAEWSTWSDRKIAEACGVSQTFVGSERRTASVSRLQIDARNGDVEPETPTKRKALRGGVEYEVETGAIGRTKPTTPQRRVDESYADPVYQDDAEYVPPERPSAATPVPAPPPLPPLPPPPPPPAAKTGPDPRDARIAQLEAEVAALRKDLAATDTKQRKPIAIERDVIGQVIPEELRPIFGAYEEYRRLIHNHLHTASRMGRKWIEVIQAESARLGFQRATLDRDYSELVANFALGADSWSQAPHAAIEHAAPSVVCIHCAGSACERCNGRGWFSGQLHIDFYRRELERRAKETAA